MKDREVVSLASADARVSRGGWRIRKEGERLLGEVDNEYGGERMWEIRLAALL